MTVYARIGLHMTYRPGTETVLAEIRPGGIGGNKNTATVRDDHRVPAWCPRGDIHPYRCHLCYELA